MERSLDEVILITAPSEPGAQAIMIHVLVIRSVAPIPDRRVAKIVMQAG
jgi:hypothetical protein